MRNAWPRTHAHWCARRRPAARGGDAHPCAEKAKLRGSGDVDDVGPEAPRVCEDARQMPPVGEVEAQILFDRERRTRRAAAPACVPEPSFAVPSAGTGADAEKGQISPAGKGLEMAAGVRHPVDLMESVGEISDPGHRRRDDIRGRRHSASGASAPEEAATMLDGLAFAESEMQLPRFVPGQAQAAAERRSAHQAHEVNRKRSMSGA